MRKVIPERKPSVSGICQGRHARFPRHVTHPEPCNFRKDLDWFLLAECLWAKCLHIAPVIAPHPYLDRTYTINCIWPFYTWTRAFQTCQISYTLLWGTPKSLKSSLIPQLADIALNMIKFISGQAFNQSKLKCPRAVGLGSFKRLNLGPIWRY